MADRIKGITIEIGGDTSSLSEAISGVNKDLKSTQDQLRDVERLLKFDPGNTQLLEQQQRLLAQSIAETSQKLEVLKKAEDQTQKKFKEGKVSREQYDALTREIVYTENALKKLNQRAEENVDAIKTAGQAIEDTAVKTDESTASSENLGEALFSIADAAGVSVPPALEKTASMLSSVNASGLAVAGTIAGIAAVLGSLTMESAKTAREIETLSAKMGMSTTEFQEWDYVMKQFGSSAADMQGDIAGLAEKAMDAANGGEDAAEAFDKLGVSVLDSQKKLKSQSQLFSEVVTKLQGVKNGTERSAIATELLSTTGENLLPVLQMNNEELAQMKQTAHDLGYVLEEDTVKGLSELDKEVSEVGQTLKNSFSEVAAFLSPIIKLMAYLVESAVLFIELMASLFNEDARNKVLRKFANLGSKLEDLFGSDVNSALGIPGYATGTPFHPGGWAMVGEQGRELVKLPRGSAVYTHSETERILSGGGDTYYITVEARNIKELDDLVWMAKNARRDRRSK